MGNRAGKSFTAQSTTQTEDGKPLILPFGAFETVSVSSDRSRTVDKFYEAITELMATANQTNTNRKPL